MTLHTYIDELDHQMDMLESKMLQKKPWYLQGETVAKDREENALLGEHLEVQRHAIYIPSAIDESTIVDFIKRGIKERAFDSAVLKVKLKETATSNKVIGGSSKTSLVEDYENLYIKAKALEKVQEDPEKDTLRREIIELFDNLDALSSMHFVPRSRVDGYNIITNKQALVLEEAGPTAIAEGDLLAPEEVFEPRGEPIKGTSEITSTDRRRHRKKLMRIRAKQREARAKMSARTDDRRAAMNKILKMAHKPGSKIKIAK